KCKPGRRRRRRSLRHNLPFQCLACGTGPKHHADSRRRFHMPGQWTSRGRLHLCVHLPAIHTYTNSASSVANRDRDSNSYTYFDTETFTDTKSCANAQSPSYSSTAPVTFRFTQSICPHQPTFPIPKTHSASLS